MKTLIKNGVVVNEGRSEKANIIIEDDRILKVLSYEETPRDNYDKEVDATGCIILPGIIDSHVHFREPGMTHKACIESESRAAAYGGVTSYFDMPNTKPQTTTPEALEDKFCRGAKDSHVNYSFFYGATNDNVESFDKLDVHRIPGIKLFMGSSTGNMLVDHEASLEAVFRKAKELSLPVMAHCEDTDIINRNLAEAKAKYGDDPDICHHPEIRSAEACYRSSSKGVEIASRFGTKFHIAHITTAQELELLRPISFKEWQESTFITGEATVAHLLFSDNDYKTLGTRIKCNPAVKTPADRAELRNALADGRITTIGTDHAPHLLNEKEGGAARAVSGMPMLQFSLVAMLELVDQKVISIERLVELMCHNPARLFSVRERGFLRPGYKADIAIVSPNKPWQLTTDKIQSLCGWSPLEGHTFNWRVKHTFCNGHHILNDRIFDDTYRGESISFR